MSIEYGEEYLEENEQNREVLRAYIKSQLLDPLKKYPTTISDTLLHVITVRLEELYIYTIRFPEIVSPNANRLDILQAILNQFLFTIREEGKLEEQISILENILYVYNRRGSIDTIENMWKYYGGDLPKDIKVNIPSKYLFRYSLSKFSGVDVYQDGSTYRSGTYEIILYNSNYPIDKLREFMLRELVAAGNRVYFTNSVYDLLVGDYAPYKYILYSDRFFHLDLREASYARGLRWSATGKLDMSDRLSMFSGSPDLFIDITNLLYLDMLYLNKYTVVMSGVNIQLILVDAIYHSRVENLSKYIKNELSVVYTPAPSLPDFSLDFYDGEGHTSHDTTFDGYFILGRTLLGSEVI